MKKVRKAVIAAAGFGTRFLPQTKAMPKEMLPIIDKPIIHYIVEELVEAGIEDIIIVTGYHKRSVEDHFDHLSADLRENLRQAGKDELLEQTQAISDLANFVYIRQKGPYGNAMPILNAEHIIGDEPFIYTFGDDFISSTPSRFKQLVDVYEEFGGSVLACVPAGSEEDYKKYGFVSGSEKRSGLIQAKSIIEKPGSSAQSPSNIASVSGYLFEPGLCSYLRQDIANLVENQEFMMQPALQRMMDDGLDIWACEIQNGKYYDTGNKIDYVKTVVDFALKHPDTKDEIFAYIQEIVQK